MPDYIECGWCGAREGEPHRMSCGKERNEAMQPYVDSAVSVHGALTEPQERRLDGYASDAVVKP